MIYSGLPLLVSSVHPTPQLKGSIRHLSPFLPAATPPTHHHPPPPPPTPPPPASLLSMLRKNYRCGPPWKPLSHVARANGLFDHPLQRNSPASLQNLTPPQIIPPPSRFERVLFFSSASVRSRIGALCLYLPFTTFRSSAPLILGVTLFTFSVFLIGPLNSRSIALLLRNFSCLF